jgi:DNA-binding transcriptional LysR family regulator
MDSALVVRWVGRSDHDLFASRAYLRKKGKPQRVSDLARHRFVPLGEPHQRENLRLIGPNGDETVKVQGPVVVHEVSFAADAITAGVGIGLLPEAYFGWAMMGGSRSATRKLIRVLPDRIRSTNTVADGAGMGCYLVGRWSSSKPRVARLKMLASSRC